MSNKEKATRVGNFSISDEHVFYEGTSCYECIYDDKCRMEWRGWVGRATRKKREGAPGGTVGARWAQCKICGHAGPGVWLVRSEMGDTYKGRPWLVAPQSHPITPFPSTRLSLPPAVMSSFYVPSTPPPRGRAYSFGQSPYPYQTTPYPGYNPLPASYYGTPGVSRSATYYVAPSVVSGRGRSHSRSRRSHSHHRSGAHHHGHHRRSHSATPRHHRSSGHVRVSFDSSYISHVY